MKISVAWCLLLLPAVLMAQSARYPLTSNAGLRPINVVIEAATLAGKKGLKVEASPESLASTTADEQLVLLDGPQFGNGTIEAEIAGDVRPGAPEGARGFVGIAFRVQGDLHTYDAFYLRPTNGRTDDQVRRNHAAQYVSHPDWPWFRLRQEFPSKYEAYVDLVPGEWTKVRIEVHGEQARLYVHGVKQPTLIVGDVKSGANAHGAIALWIDKDTIAHFRNVVVTREK
jgi:hypothetical protein